MKKLLTGSRLFVAVAAAVLLVDVMFPQLELDRRVGLLETSMGLIVMMREDEQAEGGREAEER